MTPEEVFDSFTSQDIASALSYLDQPTVGTKAERVKRLLNGGSPLKELLDAFTAEQLRQACVDLAVPSGRKAEMIDRLAALVQANDGEAPLRTQSLIPPVAKRTATKDDVVSVLRQLRVPRRKARAEAESQDEIASFLSPHFEDVFREYNIGGYFGLRIDLDIGNGKVGVEVKLAEALFTAGEAHRLIGQAVYYQRRRYGENLNVAVVGSESDLQDPGVRETLSFLTDLGISCVALPTI
jgi:hypothetical protein